MSKSEFYINRTIKLEFVPDQYVENVLRKNCDYRHFLYNKCVEIVKSMEETHPKHYIGDFSKYDLLGYIRDIYESNIIYSYRDELRPDWMEDYDYYFRGISECVVDDIETICKRIVHERSNGVSSKINFVKYNPNKLSFRIYNKIGITSQGNLTGNSIVFYKDKYTIGIKINKTYGSPFKMNLKESLDNFEIDPFAVKEIGFNFYNDKWYLNLFMEYKPVTIIDEKIGCDIRNDVAGIDLGEVNPVVIFNGKKIKKIPKHLQYPNDRIKRAEKRIKRLQACMSRKRNPDMDRFHQSKNYYKVLKKYHKAWEHLVNIKKDWHFKLAHWIVTHYKNVVVDEFHDYIIEKSKNMVSDKRRACNLSMQNKAISIFMNRLIHMCHKYGTNYYKVKSNNSDTKPPFIGFETTNTCNQCENINLS